MGFLLASRVLMTSLPLLVPLLALTSVQCEHVTAVRAGGLRVRAIRTPASWGTELQPTVGWLAHDTCVAYVGFVGSTTIWSASGMREEKLTGECVDLCRQRVLARGECPDPFPYENSFRPNDRGRFLVRLTGISLPVPRLRSEGLFIGPIILGWESHDWGLATLSLKAESHFTILQRKWVRNIATHERFEWGVSDPLGKEVAAVSRARHGEWDVWLWPIDPAMSAALGSEDSPPIAQPHSEGRLKEGASWTFIAPTSQLRGGIPPNERSASAMSSAAK
jgi:hypothetical protein